MTEKITNKNKMEINFFKKIWYSMTKFEKYPEMASEGTPRAFAYLIGLMLIFSVFVTSAFLYEFYQISQDKVKFQEYINSSELSEKFDVDVMEDGIKVKIKNTDEELTYSFNQIYAISFGAMYIYVFIIYLISVLVDTLLIVALGKITLAFARVKIKFAAIYNMSIYALTISIILNAIYIVINTLTGFEIKYFYVVYTSVAYVCLVASIFILRIDLIKRQAEVMRIIEEQKRVKQEMKEQEEPKEEDKKEEQKPTEDKNENEDEKDTEDKQEPNGSEA